MKGNVVSWEKTAFEISGASIEDIPHPETLCKLDQILVVFPQRQPLDIAKALCASHGGNIVTPKSSEENSQVMDILTKHSATCLGENVRNVANMEKAAWLGLTYRNSVWYEIDDEKIIRNPKKFKGTQRIKKEPHNFEMIRW